MLLFLLNILYCGQGYRPDDDTWGREREDKDPDTHPYIGRMGRAKAGIVESIIPPSWIAGLMKWYFEIKK